MANYISKIFGASPVAPIQDHMETCYKAAREITVLFEHVIAGDWGKVEASREAIVAYEQEADEFKKQIRGQMPKNLFMPVPREDLLNLLWAQDQIANTAAMMIACLIVIAREPTDVAIAFATSFAPMPHAMNKPKIAASAR